MHFFLNKKEEKAPMRKLKENWKKKEEEKEKGDV